MPDRTDPQFLVGLIPRLADTAEPFEDTTAAENTITQLIACLPPLPWLPDPPTWAARMLLAETDDEIAALNAEIPDVR